MATPIRSWPKLLKLMKKQFLPINYQQRLYNHYQLCKQGDRSILGYTEEFHRLGALNNLPESKQQLVSRFVLVLRDEIKEGVMLHPVAYLSDAISLATTIKEATAPKNVNLTKKTALGLSTTTFSKELQGYLPCKQWRIQKIY